VSVWDSGGVRAFYVSLIMGRQKIWIGRPSFLFSQLF
jgi:hypothetical protein